MTNQRALNHLAEPSSSPLGRDDMTLVVVGVEDEA